MVAVCSRFFQGYQLHMWWISGLAFLEREKYNMKQFSSLQLMEVDTQKVCDMPDLNVTCTQLIDW
jgi:hypothetical protein